MVGPFVPVREMSPVGDDASLRFGIPEDAPMLGFGDWGVLPMMEVVAAFVEANAYFDQPDVRQAEIARASMIMAARKYYDGNHVKPLKVKPDDRDDNVLINFCRTLVGDSVSWLFGNTKTGVLKMRMEKEEQTVQENAADLASDDEGEDVDADTEAEADPIGEKASEYIEQVYRLSNGFRMFKRWATRGGIAGHFFLKIMPNDPDEEKPMPKIKVLDPLLVSARADPMDDDEVIAYKIEWKRTEVDPGTHRADMYIYRQLVTLVDTNTWAIADYKCKDRAKRQWVLVNGPMAWPWQWSPILDGPNLEAGWGHYGLSDLEDIAGLNDAINFLASNTMRILDIHAHPKTVGTGMDAEEVQATEVDSLWTVPNPDAKLYNLEMQSDLGSSLAMLDFIKTAFWSIGRGLDPATFKDKIGQITNFALRVLAIRAINKMDDKRMLYGEAIKTLNAHLLEIAGIKGYTTIIDWPKPLPENPMDLINQLNIESEMGVTSKQTASEELGRSWALEQARIKAEKASGMTLGQMIMRGFDQGNGEMPFGHDKNGGNDGEQNPDSNQPA